MLIKLFITIRVLQVAMVTEAWTWAQLTATVPAEAKVSTECRWAAETTAHKEAAWRWVDTDEEGPEAAILTLIKTLTAVEMDLSLVVTATAK
jgi:hypothetical protein